MKKIVNISDIPLPDGVSIDSADWYYSTKADFSDEALPTEEDSDDIYVKEFEYDFYEDTTLYVKAVLNGSNDKEYPTNIIVITKHFKKALVNNFVYAPTVNVKMRDDKSGALVNINHPIFYFETDEHTSTSYKVEDTNGNVIYSRMYDKDNKYDISIPLPNATQYSALVFCVRYEFADTVEDVWGRELVVLEEPHINITLSEYDVYKDENAVLGILNTGYYEGTLYYAVETLKGDLLTDFTVYHDGVYIDKSILSDYKFLNVVFKAVGGFNGTEIQREKIRVLAPRMEYVRELTLNPTVTELTGISPETMNQQHMEDSHILEKNSDDYIDIYKITSDGTTLKKEDVILLDSYSSNFCVYYVSDRELLITYVNTDNELVAIHTRDIVELSAIATYTLPLAVNIAIHKKEVHYKDGDKVYVLNLDSGDTTELDGDYDEIDNATHVSPLDEGYFVFNKSGEFYHTSDTETKYQYSDKNVDDLFIYPTHTGVNIVYGIDEDSYIAIKSFELKTGTLNTLKEIDGTPDDYSVVYDLRKENIIMMKG
jgi:hypothetical protein